MIEHFVRPTGDLAVTVIPGTVRAPLLWRVRNALRWSFIKGWIAFHLIAPFANWWGVMTAMATLEIVKIDGKTGRRIDYGVVGYRVITDAGVAYLVDDWDGGSDDMNELDFHGLGTGTTAENANQTALVTESTTALNPNNTRASGTNSQPAANQFRTVGTLTFDADAAVTEHGIFDQAATGGGTMWDRTVFSAINVVGANGDSIQSTYTCTVSSGG
jgi:hypothetical protein